MSDRKPAPFPILLNNEVCSLIEADENVYQIRFKNRAANAYLVRGSSRTILIDVGLSSNYPYLVECLNHLGCPPEDLQGDPTAIVDGRLRPVAEEQLRRRQAGLPPTHGLVRLANVSRRSRRLRGPIDGLLVDG